MASVSIRNLSRHPVPRQRLAETLEKIAAEVLPGWEVSLVLASPAQARALNKKLRQQKYVPDVLSYVAGPKSGEIIVCPSEAARQAPRYQLPAAGYELLLFIHGLLHLKGWAHGVTMERREQALLARYLNAGGSSDSRADISNHEATYSHRHRHRNLSGQTGSRRRIR